MQPTKAPVKECLFYDANLVVMEPYEGSELMSEQTSLTPRFCLSNRFAAFPSTYINIKIAAMIVIAMINHR